MSEPVHGYDDVVGVIQLPDGTYEGTFGKKVWDEAINLGEPLVRCAVRQGTHEDVARAFLSTAVHQPLANLLSVVVGVAHAHYVVGFSIEEIMDYTTMSQSWVEYRLAVYEASPVVKQCLGQGIILWSHARLLAGIDDVEEQEAMLHQLRTYGWTVKQLEEQIRGGGDDENREASLMVPDQLCEAAAGKARQCIGCGLEEDETTQIEAVTVCGRCLHALNRIGLDPPGARWVAVPVALLREARDTLAGSQAGVRMAERIDRLLEEC